ncbi:YwqJ-related putative deaminase [Streptomyces sp. NPDC092296]|uniref:YwqJ-related putative deaminase n=1 Tax=Streptomyces sp. NPDC092296 TaxID=3366012 RepID=UPI003810A79F
MPVRERITAPAAPLLDASPAHPAGPVSPVAAPLLHQHRDSLLPAVAAALSVRGGTHTHPGYKNDPLPELHPLVAGFLAGLPLEHRERFTGRCPEAMLLSQYLATAEANRSRRAARKPLSLAEARKALKGARLTTVRIREEGDPAHGTHQPPCRSCEPMLAHFGVRSVAVGPTAD